jgi:transcriptional regulator with XRE-family HTH domain
MGDLVPMRPTTVDEPATRAEPLWRDVVGQVLRDQRHARGEKLSETAGRAGVSTQYLSEVERGRKEASSEVVSAVAGALGLSLLDLTVGVARLISSSGAGPDTRSVTTTPRGPLALAA